MATAMWGGVRCTVAVNPANGGRIFTYPLECGTHHGFADEVTLSNMRRGDQFDLTCHACRDALLDPVEAFRRASFGIETPWLA